jgi:hypothetical protein
MMIRRGASRSSELRRSSRRARLIGRLFWRNRWHLKLDDHLECWGNLRRAAREYA